MTKQSDSDSSASEQPPGRQGWTASAARDRSRLVWCGKNVLFFSEGIMRQACFEQIQSLEQRSSELRKRDLTLINITTDPAEVLREAVGQYGIKTPMISDETHKMSTAYGAIGQGMHANTDGHTFVLIDRSGQIRWRKDYSSMFVQPDQLFGEIPKIH